MWISYDDINVQGQQLTKVQTKNKPLVNIPRGMFLIMYDPDAPPKRSGKAFLHLIIDSYGNEILPYHPPTPPPKTGIHRYIFRLVKTKPITPTRRNGQPLQEGQQEIFFTVASALKGGSKKTKKRKAKK